MGVKYTLFTFSPSYGTTVELSAHYKGYTRKFIKKNFVVS